MPFPPSGRRGLFLSLHREAQVAAAHLACTYVQTPEADYLAGENYQFLIVPDVEDGVWVEASDGSRARFHALTYLGEVWGAGEPRFADDLSIAYARHIIGHGGVCTYDVPITREGLLPDAFASQLKAVAGGCRAE